MIFSSLVGVMLLRCGSAQEGNAMTCAEVNVANEGRGDCWPQCCSDVKGEYCAFVDGACKSITAGDATCADIDQMKCPGNGPRRMMMGGDDNHPCGWNADTMTCQCKNDPSYTPGPDMDDMMANATCEEGSQWSCRTARGGVQCLWNGSACKSYTAGDISCADVPQESCYKMETNDLCIWNPRVGQCISAEGIYVSNISESSFNTCAEAQADADNGGDGGMNCSDNVLYERCHWDYQARTCRRIADIPCSEYPSESCSDWNGYNCEFDYVTQTCNDKVVPQVGVACAEFREESLDEQEESLDENEESLDDGEESSDSSSSDDDSGLHESCVPVRYDDGTCDCISEDDSSECLHTQTCQLDDTCKDCTPVRFNDDPSCYCVDDETASECLHAQTCEEEDTCGDDVEEEDDALCNDTDKVLENVQLLGKGTKAKVFTLCDCEDLCATKENILGISFKAHKKATKKGTCVCVEKKTRNGYQSIVF